MNVLHLYAGNLYGGVESYLVTLARTQHLRADLGHQFGLCFRGRLWDELTAAGVTVHDLGAVRVGRPWTVLTARRRLGRLLAGGRFDAVVTHACWPHAVFGPAVRRAGARLVNAVHDAVAGRHWLERWAARTPPDAVAANSRYTGDLAAKLFPRSPVTVTYLPVSPPAVDPAARADVRAELGTPADAVVILQASRLERWKGQAVHLAALARLVDLPHWEAWFAGGAQRPAEAAYLAELTAFAGQQRLAGRVRFLGQRADVPRLLAAADVYCQPNTAPEPFGVVFAEALYAGRPVVASAAGGPVELADDTCGVLVPPGDVGAVAAALRGLLTDADRRRRLGAAGPARAAAVCDPAAYLGRMTGVLS